MMRRIFHRLFSDPVQRHSGIRLQGDGGVHVDPQATAEMIADAGAEPVERRAQADTLHRGRVEFIAEVADLLHDGFE